MKHGRQVRVRAHAKINLSLRVGPRRSDGYHSLETVFQTLALHDTVIARSAAGPLALVCDDPFVPDGRDNLAWRAAEVLWRYAGKKGVPRGAVIDIRKRVPMQAGLGGGSSDAAATLIAMNGLWRCGFDASSLGRIGAELGADVPSFLIGGTSLGLGRGDDVYPLDDAIPYHVVLAFPPFGVPTEKAYLWLDEDRAAGSGDAATSASLDLWPTRRLDVVNDLAGPVVRCHPQIGRLRDALSRSGAVAAEMTGSGSTVFGLFTNLAAARRGASAAAGLDAWAVVTRFTTGRRRSAAAR